MDVADSALAEIMDATGLDRVIAAFMLGRAQGDVASAIAEWWAWEEQET